LYLAALAAAAIAIAAVNFASAVDRYSEGVRPTSSVIQHSVRIMQVRESLRAMLTHPDALARLPSSVFTNPNSSCVSSIDRFGQRVAENGCDWTTVDFLSLLVHDFTPPRPGCPPSNKNANTGGQEERPLTDPPPSNDSGSDTANAIGCAEPPPPPTVCSRLPSLGGSKTCELDVVLRVRNRCVAVPCPRSQAVFDVELRPRFEGVSRSVLALSKYRFEVKPE